MNDYQKAWQEVGGRGRGYFSGFEERNALVEKYAWAIPDDKALSIIAKYAPIVEIGAGKGYWAKLLSDRGLDVLAYDVTVPPNAWTTVHSGGVEMAAECAVKDGKHRTLFLCWPPYAMPMAMDCLRGYMGAGGKVVIYVGEGDGGCTGDNAFHEALHENFDLVEQYYDLPQWPGINDCLEVYKRKTVDKSHGRYVGR